MVYASLGDFLSAATPLRGPVAVIFAEDTVGLAPTVLHHLDKGFAQVLVLAPFDLPDLALPTDHAPRVHGIRHPVHGDGAVPATLNRLIDAAPGVWFYYGYNSEYFHYPFCETRSVGDLIGFHFDERREAMVACIVDVYAGDLTAHPDGVDRDGALFDRGGYYALNRKDPDNGWVEKDRQIEIYGGLRWRYEQHVPWLNRRLDRVALFLAQKGLRMRPDQTFSIEEYNTINCAWHRNVTAAVVSFRAAKSLRNNPGPAAEIADFRWPLSEPFRWSSQQLMDHGFMEPGQWF
ncbi:hypothetical protein [Halodurantibacterium flavum]|uniref:Uncharacterized protein n=1 Tax=Halodurantibacterium flavum TaxID=1382802 RepID=A0ABW4S5G0_9RHOB